MTFIAVPTAILRPPQFSDLQLQRFWDLLWTERLRIFTSLFQWIVPEIVQLAGLPRDTILGPAGTYEDNRAYNQAHEKYLLGSQSGCDGVIAIHLRQNRVWTELTGLPPLGTLEDWRAAATAAGLLPADFDREDFRRISNLVLAWALAKRANHASPIVSSPSLLAATCVPLDVWQEKLEHLRQHEAITADPVQKFALKKQIEEAKQKIHELGG
jgi:hypothetical protein